MFELFIQWLVDELALAGSSLIDISKRVSLAYLFSGGLIAFFVFYWRYGRAGLKRLTPLLSWRVWWHPSARQDYVIWIVNRLLLSLLIPKSLSQAVWISWLFFFWQEQGVSSLNLGWSNGSVMLLFTLCYLLLDDFSRFFVHWAMHKIPFLWAFHQVHHSAKVLTPFTVFRTHPIEGVLFLLRSLSVQACVVSLFLVLFPHQVSLWQVFGVLISTFMFNLLGANLRHSGVSLSYGKGIEKWLISPAQHQLHHSSRPQDYDINFGVIFAFWDRVFGCWRAGSDNQSLPYGTGQAIDEAGLIGQWTVPLQQTYHRLLRVIRQRQPSRFALGLLCLIFV
ncbi:sterol desaturase family protein [Marinomonas epiphytica]